MNAQYMTHARQPNPGTLESKTPEQHQAGRKPNTHIHSISCSREHGQERVQGRGGGRNGQDRTSETMAVNWGKRARRGKNKRAYKRIKRASDRMCFWYPSQSRATLRYDSQRFFMYSLACNYTLLQVSCCLSLDRSSDILGRVLTATLCSMLLAASISHRA